MNGEPVRPSSILGFVRLLTIAGAATAASTFAVGSPVAATMQADEDAAAIRARVEEYRRAWNTHDAAALAEFFTEDADLIMGNLPMARGRQQIRDSWRDYFAGQEPERRLTLEVSPVRFIATGVALISVGTTTGGRSPDGQELTARRFRGTWLWQRRDGAWLIAAMRGFPLEEDRVVLNASLEAAETLRPEIRAFVDAYEDAFNDHDPSTVSGFYADDGEIIIRNSPLVRGREAIRNWWRGYFSQPRPYRAILIVDEIRMIAPDVALLNLTATGAASQSEDELLPVRYTRATWVIVRDAGEWLIAALWILPSEEDDIVRVGQGVAQSPG